MNKILYSSPQAEVFLLQADTSICQASVSTEDIMPSNPVDWGWTNFENTL